MAVSNLEYDILTILQSKLEAVAAYDKYLLDAQQAGNQECRSLIQELKQDEERHAGRLREQLQRMMG